MSSRKLSLVLIFLFSLSIFIGILNRPQEGAPSGNLVGPSGVAVLYLYDVIQVDGQRGFLDKDGIDADINFLYQIEKNPNVKALVLRINSPGGSVGASEELYRELIKFKARTNMPIIASIAEVGASGAYWVSLAADEIIANPHSLVGSIGVILGNINFSKLAGDYGVAMDVYKSGPLKDILSSWRTPTTTEKALLNDMVQKIYHSFVSIVAERRSLPVSEVEKVADGRFFIASDAKALGLIDEFGGFHDALSIVGVKTGLGKNPKIIENSQAPIYRWRELLGGDAELQIKNLFLKTQVPQLF